MRRSIPSTHKIHCKFFAQLAQPSCNALAICHIRTAFPQYDFPLEALQIFNSIPPLRGNRWQLQRNRLADQVCVFAPRISPNSFSNAGIPALAAPMKAVQAFSSCG
jgi:hypothetical protein